jgi:hypothetical protein
MHSQPPGAWFIATVAPAHFWCLLPIGGQWWRCDSQCEMVPVQPADLIPDLLAQYSTIVAITAPPPAVAAPHVLATSTGSSPAPPGPTQGTPGPTTAPDTTPAPGPPAPAAASTPSPPAAATPDSHTCASCLLDDEVPVYRLHCGIHWTCAGCADNARSIMLWFSPALRTLCFLCDGRRTGNPDPAAYATPDQDLDLIMYE